MGKNGRQPLFYVTVSTMSGVEMRFLVKRGHKCGYLIDRVWKRMARLGIIAEREVCGMDLACNNERVDLSKKLKDYNIREDVDPLPKLTVWLRLQ